MTEKTPSEATLDISTAHLSDFDWKVQMMVSSDKISESRIPNLLLALYVTQDDNTKKEVIVELTPSDVDALLANLDQVNEIVRKLKV